MPHQTTIEIKCDCHVPFYRELVAYIRNILESSDKSVIRSEEIPHRDEIRMALERELLFVKIQLAKPVGRWRYTLRRKLAKVLDKSVVGTIDTGRDSMTLILV